WGVDESQITVCVRDIENDCIVYERNADQWMRAGSIYKLPLSMLWFDKIAAGEASLDDEIYYNKRKYYQEVGPLGNHQTGDILTYEEVIKTTILESDNTGGQILFQTYGGWNVYRKDALRYTDVDMGNQFMLQKNYMTARYTTDVSTYLYKHKKRYKLLIEWLTQAVPHQVLDTVIQVNMPQKFGTMELFKYGTGFVEAKHPYAISVFTYGMVDPASQRMGTINSMCYEYFNQ
ncbi:MAG: serine hydrolase, partial [Erysipelotrichaceae bacterium]|nr:serine hydrolase [Erysipelotrichaceae bacterium]